MERISGGNDSTFMSGGCKVLNHSGSGSEVSPLHRCPSVFMDRAVLRHEL